MNQRPQTGPVRTLSVDAGGTFNDYLALDEAGSVVRSGKLPSNPEDPLVPFEHLLEELTFTGSWTLLHGTTRATNALLEQTLDDILLVTNRGLEGVPTIGRGDRPSLYDLNPPPDRIPFRDLPVIGVPYRHDADGTVVRRPEPEDAEALRDEVEAREPDGVAVCLVHGYRFPEGERWVREVLADRIEVVCSHEILPRFREFERMSTTVINAGLRGVMGGYLGRLRDLIEPAGNLLVMGSRRGLRSADEIVTRPVLSCLSGPAGGLMAGKHLVSNGSDKGFISLDMGGTSTDVALVPGRIQTRDNHRIGTYPIAEPMVDLHTVGAGGGSILRRDRGGHLTVGPQSAGADPGPASYGSGGPATVTDLELLLGRLPDDVSLSEGLQLQSAPAREAIGSLVDSDSPGDSFLRRAHRLVVAKLTEAVRDVTVRRGHDPSDYPLIAYGGAGGLFAAEVADALSINRVLIPRNGGVFSARGFLESDRVTTRTASPVTVLDDPDQRLPGLEELTSPSPGWVDGKTRLRAEASCRFVGQSHELSLPVDPDTTQDELRDQFVSLYDDRYGYLPEANRVELVHLDVWWNRPRTQPVRSNPGAGDSFMGRQPVVLADQDGRTAVDRHRIESLGEALDGPLLLVGETLTAFVPPGDRVVPRDDHVEVVLA